MHISTAFSALIVASALDTIYCNCICLKDLIDYALNYIQIVKDNLKGFAAATMLIFLSNGNLNPTASAITAFCAE